MRSDVGKVTDGFVSFFEVHNIEEVLVIRIPWKKAIDNYSIDRGK